jgi:hypothetical protein
MSNTKALAKKVCTELGISVEVGEEDSSFAYRTILGALDQASAELDRLKAEIKLQYDIAENNQAAFDHLEERHTKLRAELDEARKVIEICHEVGCQTATDYLASHPKDGEK